METNIRTIYLNTVLKYNVQVLYLSIFLFLFLSTTFILYI